MATRTRIHQRTRSRSDILGGSRTTLDFRAAERDEPIPGVLLIPSGDGPHPAALLLHGYSSRKEHLSDSVGSALLQQGIASLAIDLPLHGDRHDPLQLQTARNPLAIARLWRGALREGSLALRYLAARAEIDGDCIGIAGYSLGSFLSVALASREARVRAVVLAAGGDLPSGTPLAAVARAVADPLKAVRGLDGRPLLMVNGRDDRTIRPDQAERLFAAAGEPKEIRWWSSGHILPEAAIREAAGWMRERLSAQ